MTYCQRIQLVWAAYHYHFPRKNSGFPPKGGNHGEFFPEKPRDGLLRCPFRCDYSRPPGGANRVVSPTGGRSALRGVSSAAAGHRRAPHRPPPKPTKTTTPEASPDSRRKVGPAIRGFWVKA